MGDFTPIHKPGHAVTFTASAAVTGGQLVEVTGDMTVGPAGAGSAKVIGQAGHDTPAGERVTVHTPGRTVSEATASGTIAAGDRLAAAADGKVAAEGAEADPAQFVGIALTGAAADETARFQPA